MSIKLVEVDRTYSYSESSINALNGINFQIEKGEFVAFLGPAGSGKTTLLNLIGGQDEPGNGRIYVDGTDLSGLKARQLTKLMRATFGFIPKAYSLIPILSVYYNVELPMIATGVAVKERGARAQELLKLAGLSERMHQKPDELSMGDQQRLAVLCAFANRPSIILADEPTGNLDSETANGLVQMLRSLSQRGDVTVIIATQDPAVAAMTDRVFELSNGAIVKEHSNGATTSALRMEWKYSTTT